MRRNSSRFDTFARYRAFSTRENSPQFSHIHTKRHIFETTRHNNISRKKYRTQTWKIEKKTRSLVYYRKRPLLHKPQDAATSSLPKSVQLTFLHIFMTLFILYVDKSKRVSNSKLSDRSVFRKRKFWKRIAAMVKCSS